jgi:N-acetylmuramic acid 6-phosphate etherase
MVLNMLSTGAMIRLGKVYGNLMVDVQITNQKLAERARRLVSQIAAVDAAQAQRLLDAAEGQVKTAIVMQRHQVDAGQARQLLQQVDGHLRRLLEEADTGGTSE